MRDHVGWSLTGNRKQKNISNVLPEKWSQSLKKLQQWMLTREFYKLYLTEKQNGYLQSGRYERVACNKITPDVPFTGLSLKDGAGNFSWAFQIQAVAALTGKAMQQYATIAKISGLCLAYPHLQNFLKISSYELS